MRRIIQTIKQHQKLPRVYTQQEAWVYFQNYGPSKTVSAEVAKQLNNVPGRVTYFHHMPKDSSQNNFGHRLIRHIRIGFCTSRPPAGQNKAPQNNESQQDNEPQQNNEHQQNNAAHEHNHDGCCGHDHSHDHHHHYPPEIAATTQQSNFVVNDVKITADVRGKKQSVSYSIDSGDIKGNRGNNEEPLYLLAFTCGVCETKQSRTFTKNAYHKGVVLIRCEGCDKIHLIADNLGWFEDDPVNVEQLMERKGQKVARLSDEQRDTFISVLRPSDKPQSEEQK